MNDASDSPRAAMRQLSFGSKNNSGADDAAAPSPKLQKRSALSVFSTWQFPLHPDSLRDNHSRPEDFKMFEKRSIAAATTRKSAVATSTSNLKGCFSLAMLLLFLLAAMTNAFAAPTTTTTTLKIGLQATPNNAITTEPYGTSVTLTATVTGTGAAGTVAFTYGSGPTTITGCGTQAVTSGTATCTTATLPLASNESLKATFNPTSLSAFTSSSSAATAFAVTQVTTTTALKVGLQATPNTTATTEPYGTSVTLTATVTGTGAPGNVAFTYGSTPTTISGCSAVAVSSGTATCTTAALPVASNESLKAAFTSTDTTDYTSSSTATATSFAVTAVAATDTLTAALASGGGNITSAASGASVILTATISPSVAQGSVQFKVAGANLGSAATVNSSGVATLTTTALTTLGANALTAVFSPTTSANFSSNTQGSLTFTVTKPASQTALVVAPGPYYYESPVLLTANVTPSGATGGTVTFSDGGSAVATCTLSAGTCSHSFAPTLLGSNSLTAAYTLDSTYANSGTASATSISVVANPTAVAASAYQLGTTTPLTNNAITYGNSFTLSAKVTAAGSVTPSSGHVSFYDGSTLLGSPVAVNSSGVATLATSTTLAAGKHYFMASYGGVYATSGGGAELSTSVSPTVPVTISQAAPLTITASSPSVTYGSLVPVITASYTGYNAPDTSTTLTTATRQPKCTTTYTATSPVGTYPTSCSGAVDTNYTISYEPGLLTVNGATPTWSNFNSVVVTYGTAVPLAASTNSGGVITYQISTTSHGGTQTTITSVPATEPAGTYYVTASVTANGNYAAASTQRTVTVYPAPTPTWSNFNSVTVDYGTAVPLAATTNSGGAITYQVSTSSHSGPYTTITSVPATYTPGTYYVTASVTANGNYAAGSTQRTVTVNPAPLTITAPSPASTTFGSTVTISASDAIFGGFVNSETKTVLTGTLACTSDYTTISPPATYITHCTGLTSSNYAITWIDGSFVVTGVQPTVTWPTTAGGITYGHAQTSSTLGSCSATFNGSPVPGSCSWTTPSTIPHVGAAQSVTWTASGEYAADYASKTNASLSFGNVTAATLTTYTDPTASSIPVGSLLSASKLSGGSVTFTMPAGGTVTVPGTFSWATSSVVPSVPGTSSLQVTFTPTGTNYLDYNVLTNAGNASLTVTRATPTITAPTNCSSPSFTYAYGQALSACTFSTGSAAVGSTPVTGTFAWANGATVPSKGTAVNESVIFTPTAASPQLYNTVTFTVPVYVNGVTLTVNWPTASSITYGQTLSKSNLSGGYACPTTCTPSNHVAGSWAWSSSDNATSTVPHVGVAAPSVTFTPTNTNYAVATGTVSVTVLPLAPTVTAWPTAGSIFTPSTLASSDLTGGTATGLASAAVDGTFSWTASGTQPGPGTAQYPVTFTPTAGGNGNPYDQSDYSTVDGSVSITVNPCGLQDGNLTSSSFSTAQNDYTFAQGIVGLTFDLEGSINESVVCAQNTGEPFTVTLTDPSLTSGSASTNTTDSITNGTNSAVLAYGPTATAAAGATIAINNDGDSPTLITTASDYDNGVFASMGGTVSVDGTGGATTISTSGTSSHALAATYAGTLTVTNVQATTTGNSSAVIMTGGGGGVTPPGGGNGTVTVNGGTYTASGTHSSGIRAAGIGTPFSTITVTDTSATTTIAAQNDAAVVVEGGNTVTITNTDPASSVSGAGGDYHGIFLYFGSRGDASQGPGTFTMTGGTLIYTCDATLTSANPCDTVGTAVLANDQNYPATLFAVTNTTEANPANINLTDVTVINTTPSDYSPVNNPDNPNGTLLTAAALGLGNPAFVNFTAKGEQLIGDIIVDTNSTVNMSLLWDGSVGSSLTGNIGGTTGNTYYPNEGVGTINLTIDANSTWVVTGTSSYLTHLYNAVTDNSNITCQNTGQCAVYVGGSITPLAGVN